MTGISAFIGANFVSFALASVLLFATVSPAVADASERETPPVRVPKDTSQFGVGIQRTMTLLATSSPRKRNTVKILFYGQSITEQKWSAEVAEWLKKTYPYANLVIENRAIGGHSSQLLWRTAEADLYPFQPDLLIFYVYGSHLDYEKIIANVRKRTTAEILIQTEHLTKPEELPEPSELPKQSGETWSAWMSEVFLPGLAKKYGVELLDQRKAWRQYLNENNLEPKQLLRDGVHLNDWGCDVIAEIVKQHFRYLPNRSRESWQGLAKEFRIGKEAKWEGDRLRMDFDGSRVDLVADTFVFEKSGAPPAELTIRIDGKKPSEFPELYATTRASAYPNSTWPILKRVTLKGSPTVEEWRAKISHASEDGKRFSFEIFGSITGPDGAGESDQAFLSKSGKIAIEPEDWNLEYCKAVFKTPIPADLETRWRVLPQGDDRLILFGYIDKTLEPAFTIAQGLPNGKHRLELISNGKHPNLKLIRVYRPPFK